MKKVKKISVWRGKAILCLLAMILSTACLSAQPIKMQQGPDPVKFELAVSLVKRKRLSKYIFYSSFSLLTFATKK